MSDIKPHINVLDGIKLVAGLLLLVPIRLCLSLVIVVLCWVVASIAVLGVDLDTAPLQGWRRGVVRRVSLVLETILLPAMGVR